MKIKKVRSQPQLQTLRQEAALEMWKRNELDWKLKPHQKRVYDLIKAKKDVPNNRFLLNASRRWGKSYLLCVLAVEFALANPDSFIFFCASTQKQIKTAVNKAFEHILSDCPAEFRPKYNINEGRYTFPNGSQLEFSGLDNGRIEKRRGATAHLIIIDEAGFADDLKNAIESVLFPMTSTTGGQMLISSNAPKTPGHDFVKVFTRQAQADGNYCRQTIYDAGFSEEQIKTWAKQSGGIDSTTFKREYLCEFTIDADSAVVPEFTAYKSMVVCEKEKPPFFKAITTLDLGYVDFSAALFGHYDFRNAKIVIEDELLFKKSNSTTIVNACLAKERAHFGEEIPTRFCDGQLYTLNDLCTVHHYSVGAPTKVGVEAQINMIREDIQAGRLVIHPRCEKLIAQLEDAVWNSSRTKFARDSEDGHNDLIAALCYLVRHVDRSTNPYPHNYGFNPRTDRLRAQQFNPQLMAIKSLFKPKF